MTSLAEQLKQLAIPQVLQQREIKKVSLLFDEYEAGKLDRDAFYDIGLDGLRELILKDSVFSQFSENLFNINSRFLERTTQSKELNKKLDKNIAKFLRLLSPYLLLKPAHKALEWLICRYHIQDFNVGDLMGLILPYHETKIFAKILQLFNLKLTLSHNFSWLEGIQKQGVHLPKNILINHVISDLSFLRFICNSFLKTIEEHKNINGIGKLVTLVNFYCVTMVNTFSRKEVNDQHLTVLLPSLISALSSDSVNVKAAAYIICGQLVASHQLSSSLLEEFLSYAIGDDGICHLEKERALLIVLIFQMQTSIPKFPPNHLNKLASMHHHFLKLSTEGIEIEPLIQQLKHSDLNKIGKSEENKLEAKAVSNSSAGDIVLDMQECFKEFEDCQGDQKESTWLKLRPRLLHKFNDNQVFKELCKVAPSYDKLVLMLCLNRILKNSRKPDQVNTIKNILKTNFGRTNPYLQEINQSLGSDKTIHQILESFILKQHKEYDNPIEFEPWLAAMNELKNLNEFPDDSAIWELGFRILLAALPTEFNATHALQILNFLKSMKMLNFQIISTILDSLLKYIHSSKNTFCKWYDLSSKKPEIWLKVRLLEYIFEGIYRQKKLQEEYRAILDKFSKLAFFNREDVIVLISAVCGGTPFENSNNPDYYITPQLQIYSLHAAWFQFANADASLFGIFYPHLNQALCHLLICLSSIWSPVRSAAFQIIKVLINFLKRHKDLDELLFLRQLCLRSEEIIADHEQLSVVLYYLLSPSKSVQATLDSNIVPQLNKIRQILFEVVSSEDTPFYVSAKILSVLEAVNSEEIMLKLTDLGTRSIASSKDSLISRIILSNYWARMNEETANILEEDKVWELAVKCLKHQKCEEFSPTISFLKSITKEFFETLTHTRKFQLLELLVSIRSETDSSEISTAIASAVKKINIDCKIILPLITKMTTVTHSPQKLRSEKKILSATKIIEIKEWKTGVSLLELIQSKKKLLNSDLLLKPLFNVLQFCFSQEEQTTFEYAKQLVLGCLLNCCQKLSFNSQKVDESSLNVELAVQCLRASPNPQTHHHALLLLSCLASIIPNQVMHNIMAIFTFMGTSVARLDDEHSVKIVTQVVEAVVPVLMESINSEAKNIRKVMAEILLVFVWALKDIPQHRRKPLFLQLLTTLQPERSLWILLLLLIENYVLQGNPAKTENLPPNLFLGLQLTLSLTPKVILETILKIMHYLNALPAEKLNKDNTSDKIAEKKFFDHESDKSEKLFDIENSPPKQIRHFVYTTLTFLNNLLSNNSFIVQITEESKDEKYLEPAFKEIITLIMKYMQAAFHKYEDEHDKFWKAVIHQGYEILDKFVSLVASEVLLNVIKQLLHPTLGSLRKKALDLFNILLQNHAQKFSENEKKSLILLIEPILEIVREISDNNEQECEILQQTALISLKLLAKLLASENLKFFKKILEELCEIAKTKKCDGHLRGSVMLAISDHVAYLKVHSVSQLPVFLPLMIQIFSKYIRKERLSDLGLMSVTSAIHKVIDVLPHFLSPYLDKILYNVCVASTLAPETSDLNKKLIQIRQKLANNVESRVLIPSVSACYETLIEKEKFEATGILLNTLSFHFSASADIVKLMTDLTKFFFNALNFRTNAELTSANVTLEIIDKVEGFIIEALVQLVLKLSESSFRPLYYQLCHWTSEHPDRNISFFRLSCRLAESLKGLFVLFAGHFLHNAAQLLDAVNISKAEKSYFDKSSEGELKSLLLLENILKTLHLIFLYDSADTSNFLNKDKFEILLHPLVDQLDNTLGGIEYFEERRKKLLTPCLAQMALASDDTLWKSLNYQILVKTKSALSQVRIGALETIVAMAMKLGEDYLTLLPETIGYLAELLEDEDEKVENAMKKAIQDLEEILGQPIREYFQQ